MLQYLPFGLDVTGLLQPCWIAVGLLVIAGLVWRWGWAIVIETLYPNEPCHPSTPTEVGASRGENDNPLVKEVVDLFNGRIISE